MEKMYVWMELPGRLGVPLDDNTCFIKFELYVCALPGAVTFPFPSEGQPASDTTTWTRGAAAFSSDAYRVGIWSSP
ncbi:hypothetical protein COP2_010657 [Malus domestica]